MAEIKLPVLIGSIAVTAILSSGLAAGGVLLFAGDKGKAAAKEGESGEHADDAKVAAPLPPPIYHAIEPSLLVNFDAPSGPKYLQIAIQVMSRHEAVIERLEQMLPAVRNDLIVLLSAQDPSALRSQEGKLALRGAVLEAIRGIVGEIPAEDEDDEEAAPQLFGVEDVYFTNFVMQ
jgi:flagellar FliL protein